MKQVINYTTISEINQTKLFDIFYYQIEDGDPVLELINILEGLDLTEFKKLFKHKTKVNPIRLLAVIIYAYSRNIKSLREIEICCKENIKFKYLLNGALAPDYTTIFRFMKKCEYVLEDIFIKFNKKILEIQNIDTNNIYIDGTKIEAYANKYTFVWKKAVIKNKEKNKIKIEKLINEVNSYYGINLQNLENIIEYLSSKNIEMVKGKGKRKSIEQKLLEKALSFFEKNEEYEKHLNIVGDRNSYSKTDKDATFMRMKDDYMRNGQLKPGYNLQIGVCSEIIIDFKIFSNPTDVKTLIPFLDKLNSDGYKLKNIVADSGYESLLNYELRRKDGLVLEYIKDIKYSGVEYKLFKNPETNKNVRFNFKFREYSNKSRGSICSIKRRYEI